MGSVMEPRELWERHTVLAKAFCHSDEEVRTAQTTLDDAQASRARSLAAFAVVVGNDKAVAEMLGLPEREVRIARRTVGREDARTLADELLLPPMRAGAAGGHASSSGADGPEDPARTQENPQVQPTGQGPPPTAPGGHHQQPLGQQHGQLPPQAPQSPQSLHTPLAQPAHEAAPHVPDSMGWSPVQDAVLIDGWQAGVDMEILAVELGTDLPRLTARAQYLSAQGRLFAPVDENGVRQGGKHRREGGAAAAPVPQHASVAGPSGYPVGPMAPMGSAADVVLPDGLVPDGLLQDGSGGYWANWNEMLQAQ